MHIPMCYCACAQFVPICFNFFTPSSVLSYPYASAQGGLTSEWFCGMPVKRANFHKLPQIASEFPFLRSDAGVWYNTRIIPAMRVCQTTNIALHICFPPVSWKKKGERRGEVESTRVTNRSNFAAQRFFCKQKARNWRWKIGSAVCVAVLLMQFWQ